MVSAYLQLPLLLLGQTGSDGTVFPDKIGVIEVLPAQVITYHDAVFPDQTIIYLANGAAFVIALSVEGYKRAIQAYWYELA